VSRAKGEILGLQAVKSEDVEIGEKHFVGELVGVG